MIADFIVQAKSPKPMLEALRRVSPGLKVPGSAFSKDDDEKIVKNSGYGGL